MRRGALASLLTLGAAIAGSAETTSPFARGAEPQTQPEITTDDLMAHIRALASEEMEGRKTGEPGGRRAEEYLAAAFQRLGLEPAGEEGGYFQRFEFVSGVTLSPSSQLRLQRRRSSGVLASEALRLDLDWRPLGYSKIGAAPARCVVFAGYGLRFGREGRPGGYDSYGGATDIGGCWALVWRGAPPDVERPRLAALLRVAGIAYKASIARSKGAFGLIVADGPGAGYPRGLPPLRFGPRSQRDDLPVLALSRSAAERVLRAGGLDPALEAERRREGARDAAPARLDDVQIAAQIDLEVVRAAGRNVVARLGLDAPPGAPPLVIGAHLDHLGRGGDFSSLARVGERGMIHYGADDNASGVAAVLEIAERMVGERALLNRSAARDIVFAGWMGEELGLLGSAAYVAWVGAERAHTSDAGAPPQPAAGYVNLDMIGRLNGALTLSGLGSSPDWRPTVRIAGAGSGLTVELEENAYLPTDATSFFLAGSPVLSLSTGQHDEYHSPRDRPPLINAKGLKKVTVLVERMLRLRLAAEAPPAFQPMLASRDRSSRRRGAVSLGVAPAFAPGDVQGVALLGVIENGAAAEAGVASGDVLIELAGERLVTLYDLVRVLDGLAPNEPVALAFRRRGEILRRVVTPRVRE